MSERILMSPALHWAAAQYRDVGKARGITCAEFIEARLVDAEIIPANPPHAHLAEIRFALDVSGVDPDTGEEKVAN